MFYGLFYFSTSFYPISMILESLKREFLGLHFSHLRPVLTGKTGPERPEKDRSFPVLVFSGPLIFWSFPVQSQSSLGLWPVPRLDLQTLDRTVKETKGTGPAAKAVTKTDPRASRFLKTARELSNKHLEEIFTAVTEFLNASWKRKRSQSASSQASTEITIEIQNILLYLIPSRYFISILYCQQIVYKSVCNQ